MPIVDLVLIVGATARLTRLVQTDSILAGPRGWLTRRLDGHKIAELLWCPWCLSPYIGAAVAASWWAWSAGRGWSVVAAALTASLATGLLATWEDR